MNLKKYTLLVTSLFIGACSNVAAQFPSTLEQAKITLQGNHISASLHCNTLTGQFLLQEDQRIQVSELGMTRRACLNNAMQEDKQLHDFLMSKPLLIQENQTYFLSAGNLKIPVTKEDMQNKDGIIKFIYVQGQKKSCEGVVKQMCLQIRNTEQENWQNFYDDIEGFEPNPKHNYRLRIKEYSLQKQQDNKIIQDRSQKRWVLDLIVEQKLVK